MKNLFLCLSLSTTAFISFSFESYSKDFSTTFVETSSGYGQVKELNQNSTKKGLVKFVNTNLYYKLRGRNTTIVERHYANDNTPGKNRDTIDASAWGDIALVKKDSEIMQRNFSMTYNVAEIDPDWKILIARIFKVS